MITKSWLVTCKLNDGMKAKLIIKSHSERKAKNMAINKLFSKGYMRVDVISCKKMKGEILC